MYSTTSLRPKFMQRNDEEDISMMLFALAIIHVVLIILRVAKVIEWNWLAILLPEILVIGVAVEIAVILLFKKLVKHNRRRMYDGK